MKIREFLASHQQFEVINEADFDRDFTSIYCCDLLSIVMGRAPADCAWVTVMGNLNGVAVAVLADMACIVIAENAPIDDVAITKAGLQEVNIIKTDLPVFDAALLLHECLT